MPIPTEAQILICTLGIYTCYLRYGFLQERIYSQTYGLDENFTFSSFLVTIQTATNASIALLALLLGFSKPTKPPSSPPLFEYAFVALSYLLAMLFSFTALNHMSYPMQALGKSCKMIPVMLMGIFIRGRRYSRREFLCVALITAGVAMFSWKGNSSTADSNSKTGFFLLFASLFMDGVTGPLQERLVARHHPSTHQLMFWQNACSTVWLIPILAFTGEGLRAVQFVRKYPNVMIDVMAFSLVSAIGQNFIFYTVRNFSALLVTTITTTRKMFTVLLSIFVYNHRMLPRQWSGLLLVFTAIAWEAVAKQRAKKDVKVAKKDE